MPHDGILYKRNFDAAAVSFLLIVPKRIRRCVLRCHLEVPITAHIVFLLNLVAHTRPILLVSILSRCTVRNPRNTVPRESFAFCVYAHVQRPGPTTLNAGIVFKRNSGNISCRAKLRTNYPNALFGPSPLSVGVHGYAFLSPCSGDRALKYSEHEAAKRKAHSGRHVVRGTRSTKPPDTRERRENQPLR